MINKKTNNIFSDEVFEIYNEKQLIKVLDNLSLQIKNNVDFVLNWQDFLFVVNYFQKILFNQSNNWVFCIDDKIKTILGNTSFLEKLNSYISSNFPNIEGHSNDIYEKISLFISLLWLWKYFDIVNDLNSFDSEKLEKLYLEYISNIKDNINNKEKLNIYIDSFLNLSELINQICILNLGNYFKSKYAFDFKELFSKIIIEVLDIINNKIDDFRVNLLQNFLLKLTINFSLLDERIFSKEVIKKDFLLDELILKLDSILKDIFSTYKILEPISNNKNIQKVFVGNYLYTLIIFFDSLESKKDEEFIQKVFDNENFKSIINDFLLCLWDEYKDVKINNIYDIKKFIERVFVWMYFEWRRNFLFDDLKKDFFDKKGDVSYFNLQCFRCLVQLKSKVFSDNELIFIWEKLLKEVKYENFNFNFSKLKIIVNIIENLSKDEFDLLKYDFIKLVSNYIKNNNYDLNLLYIYAEIHLTIARYLSYFLDETSHKEWLEFYYLFLKSVPKDFDFSSYWKELGTYEYRIGLYYLNNILKISETLGLKWKNIFLIEEEILKRISKDEIFVFWKKYLNDFLLNIDYSLKNKLDKILLDLLDNALNQDWFDEKKINIEASKEISEKIFNNIASVYILNIKDENDFNKGSLANNFLEIELFGDYKMFFVYPKIYEDVFFSIYNKEKLYIEKSIKNIINSYLKRKAIYIDYDTWLPNETKLKLELSWLEKKVSFILIKINIIKNINDVYGYEFWDEFIKKVSIELQKIDDLKWNIYRLFSRQFWIIIHNNQNIDCIIDRIRNIKIDFFWNNFNLNAVMWIVRNDNKRLIEKWLRSISYRTKMWFTSYEYDKNTINHDKNKENLYFLQKLDKAIEEKRLKLFFQPLFDAKTLKPYKYEVLMRILNEDWVYESPFKYLEAASYFWKLDLIAYVIIEETFKYASINWWSYSINLSEKDLSNKKVVDFIYQRLLEYRLKPENITIEILERLWMEEWSDLIKIIEQFKEKWFKIAMDDFWRDWANFKILLEFIKIKQLDYLKVDQKIIQSLSYSKDYNTANITSKMLRWIIDWAHSSWIKVVAEYVDSQEILDVCIDLWFDLLQWFYLGKPGKDILK